MNDTDRHERIAPALHPDVVKHCEDMCKAARHYKYADEVIADYERLLEMARGERQ